MKRSQTKFPLQADIFLEFLKNMWEQGWLDDYSDDHFLIKAIENRLTDFWGKQQAYLDNTVVFPVINEKNFVPCFLMNHDFTTFINDTLAVELAVLRHS